MKIISWNVNSVRARIENIRNYIKDSSPDVLLLQEIKTQNENFPSNEFDNLGYTSHVFGQKSYNGVAIISKTKLKKVKTDFYKKKIKQLMHTNPKKWHQQLKKLIRIDQKHSEEISVEEIKALMN